MTEETFIITWTLFTRCVSKFMRYDKNNEGVIYFNDFMKSLSN